MNPNKNNVMSRENVSPLDPPPGVSGSLTWSLSRLIAELSHQTERIEIKKKIDRQVILLVGQLLLLKKKISK